MNKEKCKLGCNTNTPFRSDNDCTCKPLSKQSESWEEELKLSIQQELDDQTICGKEIHGDAECGVVKDCHVHDWRQKEFANKQLFEIEEEVEKLEEVDFDYEGDNEYIARDKVLEIIKSKK